MSGARPMEGSSSSNKRGRAISARPSASICCSPPDKVPADLADPLAQARKTLEHQSQLQTPVRIVVSANQEVFADRHIGENHFSLRHQHGGIADAPAREAAQSVSRPPIRTAPLQGGSNPTRALSKEVFPAPFAPSSPTISPEQTCRLAPRTASRLPYPQQRLVTCSSISERRASVEGSVSPPRYTRTTSSLF